MLAPALGSGDARIAAPRASPPIGYLGRGHLSQFDVTRRMLDRKTFWRKPGRTQRSCPGAGKPGGPAQKMPRPRLGPGNFFFQAALAGAGDARGRL